MFKFLKNKENNHEVVAIVSGKMCNISQVEDPMFSSKMMGDGLAIISDKDEVVVCSPCSGDLKVLFPTGHAFGVKMKNGVEILVHIGVNTVESRWVSSFECKTRRLYSCRTTCYKSKFKTIKRKIRHAYYDDFYKYKWI